MAFTTWQALQQKLLDAIADGSWTRSEFQIDGRRTTFRSVAEVKEMLAFVEAKAADEAGTGPAGRTYAQSGGRGYAGGCP